MENLFTVKLDSGAKYDVRASDELGIEVGDKCVIRKDFFQDFGVIERKGAELEPGSHPDIPSVIRKASVHDLSAADENLVRAKSALRTTQRFVDDLKLEMKLLNAHYSLDNKMLVIQFTADGRVDFRELVKQLSHALNTRIELRQIGVRDEAAIYGGISVCGEQLCCCRFLKEFSSINVKMAKEQDLSLTPSTISGVCGRLKCCLKYEHEGYLEMEKTMPHRGEYCEGPEGKGRVVDRNLLTQTVLLELENNNVVRCKASELKKCPRPACRPRTEDAGKTEEKR